MKRAIGNLLGSAALVLLACRLSGSNDTRAIAANRVATYPASVYYFPLSGEIYGTITERSIEDYSDLTSVVKDDIPDLIRMLNTATGKPLQFSPTQIRLKVVLSSGELYLVDIAGCVKHVARGRNGKVSFSHLSLAEKSAVRQSILSCFPDDAR